MNAGRSTAPPRAVFLFAVLAFVLAVAPSAQAQIDCSQTSTGLIPLNDLGSGTYEGEVGGLYPVGSNEIPEEHLQRGLELAAQVVPRAADGTPNPKGLIGFISIGVSNTLAEFNAFTAKVVAGETNSALALVNGAQVGRALGQWARPQSSAWSRVDRNLAESGVSAEQVQVAWIMLPERTRGPRTLDEAREMEGFTRVLQTAKEEYPNLALVYLSSRIYGGYIPDADSEPNAYNHGYQVKWLIEEQINGSSQLNPDPARGTVLVPWIAWGPYLWADGTTPRSDGLVWNCEDFTRDGVHPGEGAQEKVATMLMDHFYSDPTAAGWFPLSPGQAPASTTSTTSTAAPSTTSTTLVRVTSTVVPGSPVPEARTPDGVAGAPGHWPAALTGFGAGLAVGLLLGLVVLRTRSGAVSEE